jgi:hypothetical protein
MEFTAGIPQPTVLLQRNSGFGFEPELADFRTIFRVVFSCFALAFCYCTQLRYILNQSEGMDTMRPTQLPHLLHPDS